MEIAKPPRRAYTRQSSRTAHEATTPIPSKERRVQSAFGQVEDYDFHRNLGHEVSYAIPPTRFLPTPPPTTNHASSAHVAPYQAFATPPASTDYPAVNDDDADIDIANVTDIIRRAKQRVIEYKRIAATAAQTTTAVKCMFTLHERFCSNML